MPNNPIDHQPVTVEFPDLDTARAALKTLSDAFPEVHNAPPAIHAAQVAMRDGISEETLRRRDRYDRFRPYVMVRHNGEIEIDFTDVHDGTFDGSNGVREVEDEYEGTPPGVKLLDSLVTGGGTTVDKLRALADYIEGYNRANGDS